MKSFWTGPILKLLIAAAIGITLVNDVGSIASSHYYLRQRVEKVADRAEAVFEISNSKAAALQEAESAAAESESILTAFEITNDHILNISIEIPNRKTWLAHRFEYFDPLLHASVDYERDMRR